MGSLAMSVGSSRHSLWRIHSIRLQPAILKSASKPFSTALIAQDKKKIDKEELLLHFRARLQCDEDLSEYTRHTLQDIVHGRVRTISGVDETVRFKCTACGECCREYGTSLTLTPFDMWRMSRAPTLNRHNISSTTSLAKSMGPALVLTPGDQFGVPLCRLRTVPKSYGTVTYKRNTKGRPALACVLGPAHMPTKCASFPISRGFDEATGYFFEVPQCEGLGHESATPRSLQSYVQSNQLAAAWDQSDWFRKQKARIGDVVRYPDMQSSSRVASRTFSILGSAWFDFDSLPGSRLEAWDDAKARIEVNTRQYLEAVEAVNDKWERELHGGSDLSQSDKQLAYWRVFEAGTGGLSA